MASQGASQRGEKSLLLTRPRIRVALLNHYKPATTPAPSQQVVGGDEVPAPPPSAATTQQQPQSQASKHPHRIIDATTVPPGYWVYPAFFQSSTGGAQPAIVQPGENEGRRKRARDGVDGGVADDEDEGEGRPTTGVPVQSQPFGVMEGLVSVDQVEAGRMSGQGAVLDRDQDQHHSSGNMHGQEGEEEDPASMDDSEKILARMEHLAAAGDEVEHRPALRRQLDPASQGGLVGVGGVGLHVPDWRDLDSSFYSTRKAAETDYEAIPIAAVRDAVRVNKASGLSASQQFGGGAVSMTPATLTPAATTAQGIVAGMASGSGNNQLLAVLNAFQPAATSFTTQQMNEFHKGQQVMLAADLSSGSAAKHYNVFTRDQVANFITKLPSTRRNLYVVVDPELPCDPFFDLDVGFASHPEIVDLIKQAAQNLNLGAGDDDSTPVSASEKGSDLSWSPEAEARAKDAFVVAAVQFLSDKLVEYFVPEEKKRKLIELEHYLGRALEQLQAYNRGTTAASTGGEGYFDSDEGGGGSDGVGIGSGFYASGDLMDLSEPPTDEQRRAQAAADEAEDDAVPAARPSQMVQQPGGGVAQQPQAAAQGPPPLSLEGQKDQLLTQAREAQAEVRVDKVTVLDASTEGKKWSFHIHFKLSGCFPAAPPATPLGEGDGNSKGGANWSPVFFEGIDQFKRFATMNLAPLQQEVNLRLVQPEGMKMNSSAADDHQEADAVPLPAQGEVGRATTAAPVTEGSSLLRQQQHQQEEAHHHHQQQPAVDPVLTDTLDHMALCVISCLDLAIYSKWRCFRLPLNSKRTGKGQCGAVFYPWRPSGFTDRDALVQATPALQLYPDNFFQAWQRTSAGSEASPKKKKAISLGGGDANAEGDEHEELDPELLLEQLVNDCMITPPVHQFADRLELGDDNTSPHFRKFSSANPRAGQKAAFADGPRVGVTETQRQALRYIFRHLHPEFQHSVTHVRGEFEDNGTVKSYRVYQKQSKYCYILGRSHAGTYGQLYLTFGSLKYRCYSNDCHRSCKFVAWDSLSTEVQRLKATVLFPDLGDEEKQRRYGDYQPEPC